MNDEREENRTIIESGWWVALRWTADTICTRYQRTTNAGHAGMRDDYWCIKQDLMQDDVLYREELRGGDLFAMIEILLNLTEDEERRWYRKWWRMWVFLLHGGERLSGEDGNRDECQIRCDWWINCGVSVNPLMTNTRRFVVVRCTGWSGGDVRDEEGETLRHREMSSEWWLCKVDE